MRRIHHSAVAVCVLTIFWPAIAICEPASLWDQNGSVMALYANGAERIIRYQEPRIGMQQEGVAPGTVRFEGTQSGTAYTGTAFVFSRRCGTHPYRVTGTISADEREITLQGTAPSGFDAACRQVASRRSVAYFRFLRFAEATPVAASAIDRDKSAEAEAAAERARLEDALAAKEQEEERLRKAQEDQERQTRELAEQQARAERARRALEELRLTEMRDFSDRRDGCRSYNVEACAIALTFARASPQDIADLRKWRDVGEKFRTDRDSCRTGSLVACDEALASPALAAEQRHQLDGWRLAASPSGRAMAFLSLYAKKVATATSDGVSVLRNLPAFARVAAGFAAVLALAFASMAMRSRRPYPRGGTRAPAFLASDIADSQRTGSIRWWLATPSRRQLRCLVRGRFSFGVGGCP